MPDTTQYTNQQQRVFDQRGKSLALDAGAGCGKTFVLTKRFLNELESSEGTSPDERLHRLVAITFTDAAARELRTRIRNLVYERVVDSSGEARAGWLRLQRTIDGSRISTIHSLCTSILREHAFAADLDPLFTTLDGPAALVLQAEAVEETLRELLTVRQSDVMLLGSHWNVTELQEKVRRMMVYHRDAAFADWCDRTPEELLASWRSYYAEFIWGEAIESLQPVAEELLALAATVEPSTADEHDFRDTLMDGLRSVLDRSITPVQLGEARKCAVSNRKPFSGTYWRDNKQDFERFKVLAVTFREAVDKIPKFDPDNELVHEIAKLGLALARVASKAAKRYETEKLARGALDFDDLLSVTHRLLSAPDQREVRQQLQSEISLLFVDEFQDTDRVQVDMVRALVGDIASEGKLLFVGDAKQSIYRFRGAEPDVFTELQEEIDKDCRLPLSVNFRSQPAVLKFVNALFEPRFTNYEPLQPHRDQATPEPAIEFLWTHVPKPESSGRKVAGHVTVKRREEARRTAARLREMVDDQRPLVVDDEYPTGRAPRYGDIAILFRALSDVAAYEEALRSEGIPYYLVGGHAFYTQQEIYDILHLLRVVASECDELSLAGVLRSPMFSLADESLFWLNIRHKSLERGLFAETLPSELDADEQAKVRRAAATLQLLRQHRDDWSVPQLLSEAMERTGYDAALLADFMGERKLANVQKLVEQARSAVESGVGTLDDFVTQLAEFITDAPKEALATTSPDTANVVRLMTVHKSKGLEFPVVVVADMDRKANQGGSPVEFTPELGPMVSISDKNLDEKKPASGIDLFRHIDKQADEAEIDRLFYVACTRAADYLLLSGGVEDFDKPQGPLLKRLAESFDLASGELLDPSRVEPAKRPVVQATIVDPLPSKKHRGGRSTNWMKVVEQARQGSTDANIERTARPVEVSPTARRRFSVTRLSGQIIPAGGDSWRSDPEASEKPDRLAYDPLGLGTLVHGVLERVDLADPDSFAGWAQALAPHHDLLHAPTAATMATDLVERFARSPRAKDMLAAQELHHEVEFQLTWPLGSTDAGGRYVQGYLDCLYLDADGEWCVVDYKTNQVADGGVRKEAEKYELQMLVYGLAVEQATGKGPRQLVLHFLRPGAEHVFPWDDAARRRAVALVNEALTKIDSQAASSTH